MFQTHVIRPAVFLALAAVTAVVSIGPVTAQQTAGELRLHVGDMLELGTDARAVNPQFNWVLTRDRAFQNAQRTRFYQTRFSQAGTYVLDVTIQNPSGGENDYRAFTVIVDDVAAPIPSPPGQSEGVSLAVGIRTEPAIVDGKAYLPADGGILKIDPSPSLGKIASYDIDLDASVDSDADGNPTNDRDTTATLSQKNGTPIYVHMLPKQTGRTITVSVSSLSVPTPSTASFDVVFGGTPPPGAVASASSTSSVPGQSGPISVDIDGRTASFRATLDATQASGKELLYSWDFGDRGKSLLDSPSHTYAAGGTYAVTLTVTDITTGQIFFTSTASVSASSPSNVDVSSASSSSTVTSSLSSSSASSAPSGSSGFSIGSVVKVVLIMILLLAVAIGLYAVIHWVKGKATGRLQDTLEKMEKTIVKKDAKTDAIEGAVEPMKLKKEPARTDEATVVTERELAKTEFSSGTRTNETPIATVGPVPDWLAKAGTTPAPKQEAAPVARPVSAAASGPVPDWLKPKTPTPPVATTVSKPLVQATHAVTAPREEKAPVPDWLKPKPQSPTTPTPLPTVPPTGKTVETPKPQQAAVQPKPEQPKQSVPKAKAAEPTAKSQTVQASAAADQKKQSEPQKPKAETPKPQGQKQQLKPQPEPKAKPNSEAQKPVPAAPAVQPQPTTAPAAPVESKNDDDQTIAIIQADSLSK